eukprot:4226462-Lingulodinium_polyedra.AAC.1
MALLNATFKPPNGRMTSLSRKLNLINDRSHNRPVTKQHASSLKCAKWRTNSADTAKLHPING